jgi:hypothetical protein
MFAFLLILSTTAYAGNNTEKYQAAGKVVVEATLKQTGLEQDFLKIKEAAEGRGRKYLKDNGMEYIAGFVGFTYTSLVEHKVRCKTGNVLLEMTDDKKQLTWGFQF